MRGDHFCFSGDGFSLHNFRLAALVQLITADILIRFIEKHIR